MNAYTLLPPLFAITFALLTRKVIPSLLIAAFIGIGLISGWSLEFISIFSNHFFKLTLLDQDHLTIILFSILISINIHILQEKGSLQKLIDYTSQKVKTKQKAEFTVFFSGLLIFFDDYANTLILGNGLKKLTDKFNISREKLAYLVDSTSAPVASIAIISTWIGCEVDHIAKHSILLTNNSSAYEILIKSIPYALYPILTLVFILISITLQIDLFPFDKKTITKSKITKYFIKTKTKLEPHAIIPLVVLFFTSIIMLLITGWNSKTTSFSSMISHADPYLSLLAASIFSLIATIIFHFDKIIYKYAVEGTKKMTEPIAILISAWFLSSIISELQTGQYITSMITSDFPIHLFPLLIFLLGAIISFSTGTSWGTMAILFPITIPLIENIMVDNPNLSSSVIYASIASILSGSVFGDHCSPISDTTIMSSMDTECKHIDHVKTQTPYALVVAGISSLGLLFAGFGYPYYVILPVSSVFIFLLLYNKKKHLES